MNIFAFSKFAGLYLLASLSLQTRAETLAFPSAEGFGRFALGGRGGEVYAVTNLNDSGPGSLRDAVSAPDRTIIFKISGTIELQSDLMLTHPRITIAGQSAPGDGICLKKFPLRISKTNDVIVRYLRVRPGTDSKQPVDGIEAQESTNVIIDHCSVSWSQDEGINTWHGCKDITVQWCMVAEPLNKAYNRGAHAFAATIGGVNASFHHNLFAHCTARNPSVGGNHKYKTENADFRCNLIYNHGHRSCDGKPHSINIVNNYYKPGPATSKGVKRRIVRIDDAKKGYGFLPVWHIEGNQIEGAPDLAADNWKGGVEFDGATNALDNRSLQPFPFAPVMTQSADQAAKLVLENVGATRPRRDAVDKRIIHEVRTTTATFGESGIIDSQAEVGGWPELKSAEAPPDSDGDGMPDTWELAHKLDPKNSADGKQLAPDGYSHLEHYLNHLAGE